MSAECTRKMLALLFSAFAACETGASFPDGGNPALRWRRTCGDAVCKGYVMQADKKPCGSAAHEGDYCAVAGAECDPISSCNLLLKCADADPCSK